MRGRSTRYTRSSIGRGKYVRVCRFVIPAPNWRLRPCPRTRPEKFQGLIADGAGRHFSDETFVCRWWHGDRFAIRPVDLFGMPQERRPRSWASASILSKLRRRSGCTISISISSPASAVGRWWGEIRAADCSYLSNVGNGVIGQVMDPTAR